MPDSGWGNIYGSLASATLGADTASFSKGVSAGVQIREAQLKAQQLAQQQQMQQYQMMRDAQVLKDQQQQQAFEQRNKVTDQMLKAETPEGVQAVAANYAGLIHPVQTAAMMKAAEGFRQKKLEDMQLEAASRQGRDIVPTSQIPTEQVPVESPSFLPTPPPMTVPSPDYTQIGQTGLSAGPSALNEMRRASANLSNTRADAGGYSTIGSGNQKLDEMFNTVSDVVTKIPTPGERHAWLEQNSPGVLNELEAIKEGRSAPSKFGKYGTIMSSGVQALWPGTDEMILEQRRAMRRDYGRSSSLLFKNSRSLSTIANHLKTLNETFDDLDLKEQPIENFFDLTVKQLTGDPTVTARNATQLAVVLETHPALSGVSITDQDFKQWMRAIPEKLIGKNQAKSAVQQLAHLVVQRAGVQQEGINAVMGDDTDMKVLMPSAEKALAEILNSPSGTSGSGISQDAAIAELRRRGVIK